MIIQVNVVLRHCRQQQPYSGLRIHPHDHTQPTYEKIQFCYLVHVVMNRVSFWAEALHRV